MGGQPGGVAQVGAEGTAQPARVRTSCLRTGCAKRGKESRVTPRVHGPKPRGGRWCCCWRRGRGGKGGGEGAAGASDARAGSAGGPSPAPPSFRPRPRTWWSGGFSGGSCTVRWAPRCLRLTCPPAPGEAAASRTCGFGPPKASEGSGGLGVLPARLRSGRDTVGSGVARAP